MTSESNHTPQLFHHILSDDFKGHQLQSYKQHILNKVLLAYVLGPFTSPVLMLGCLHTSMICMFYVARPHMIGFAACRTEENNNKIPQNKITITNINATFKMFEISNNSEFNTPLLKVNIIS